MKKRFLSIIMALCLILTFLPVTALASDESGSGEENRTVTSFADLKTALENGEDVTLGADITADDTITISKDDVTLDLGKYTLTKNFKSGNFITVSGGASLTITGSGTITEGEKVTSGNMVQVTSGFLNLQSGTIQSGKGYAVYVESNGTFTMNGGKLETLSGSYYATLGLFSSQNDNQISGGTIQGWNYAIMVSGSKLSIGTSEENNADIQITQSAVGSPYALLHLTGVFDVTILSGTFQGTQSGSMFNSEFGRDGARCTIWGGKFSSSSLIFDSSVQYITVSGGTFNKTIPVTVLDSEKTLQVTEDGNYEVVPLTNVPVTLTYEGGTTENYGSVSGALAQTAGKSSAVVTVQGDVSESSALTVPAGVSLTVNGGKTLNCGAITVSNGATLTNNGAINADNFVTNKGTLTNSGSITAGYINATAGSWTGTGTLTLTGNDSFRSAVSGNHFTGTLSADSTKTVKLAVVDTAVNTGVGQVEPGTWIWNGTAWVDANTIQVYQSEKLLLATDLLSDALTTANQAGDGCTIKLLDDVTSSGLLPSIQKNLTLDLGGHTIFTSSALYIGDREAIGSNPAVSGTNPIVTIQNGTISSTGAGVDVIRIGSGSVTADNLDIMAPVSSISTACGVSMTGGAFTLEADSSILSGSIGIQVLGTGTTVDVYGSVTTQGKNLKVPDYGIMGNGTDTTNSTITLHPGATVQSDGMAIYHPQTGTLNIDGATVTGGTGVAMKGGTLNVTGDAVITATGEKQQPVAQSSGVTDTGDAIYVEGNYSDKRVVVNIEKGTITSAQGNAVQVAEVVTTDPKTNGKEVNVTGGTISGNVVIAEDGKTSITGGTVTGTVSGAVGDVSVTGGSINGDVSQFIPQGNTYYTVTFDANGGTCSQTSRTVFRGSAVGTLPGASRTGYTFTGWYYNGTAVNASTVINSNMTLEAGWTAASTSSGSSSSSYSPVMKVSGGGSVRINPRTPEAGDKVTITPDPDRGYEIGTVTVLDRNGRQVDVTAQGDGTYLFVQPQGRVTIQVTFVPAGVSVFFTDVAESFWAYDEIQWAFDNGYVNGTSATTFSPNASISRQQVWMILARLSGANPADMAAAKAWAVSNGISDGSAYGNPVTRQQLVALLYRYAVMMNYANGERADLSAFPDAETVASYAEEAMAWSVANGIVGGTTAGTLNPVGTATRAQFTVILYRFWEQIG